MTFLEVIVEFKNWIGGGTAVGILSAVLIYRSSKKGRDIDWYDRAINQVKDLDKEVEELKGVVKELNGIIRSLNSEVTEERTEKIRLLGVVAKLEEVISGLKIQIEEKKEDTKKDPKKKGEVINEQI